MTGVSQKEYYGFLKFHVIKILKILDSSISSGQFLTRKIKAEEIWI